MKFPLLAFPLVGLFISSMSPFYFILLTGLASVLAVMSGNGETSAVMEGVIHGACDYLIKPVGIKELRNVWQHVVRKKRQEVKAVSMKSIEEAGGCERQKRAGGADDADYTSSATDTTDGNWKLSKRRKGEFKEENEDDNEENDDPSTMKKPRVVWSVELHQQFVSAVNQLGIDSKFLVMTLQRSLEPYVLSVLAKVALTYSYR